MTDRESAPSSKGALHIVGLGIQFETHVTLGAKRLIEGADKVLFALSNKLMEMWLKSIAPDAESLPFYITGEPRTHSYLKMVERILEELRKGQKVCVVYYGHPGVFAFAPHEAIRQARIEGYKAEMIPGISAEDCLFADLGVDPANYGCQSFEATDFLIRRRRFDPRCSLVLWQINVIGHLHEPPKETARHGLSVLVEVLLHHYDPDHEVVAYQASSAGMIPPVIMRLPLSKLPTAEIPSLATLYISPKEETPVDTEMMERLNISSEDLRTPQRPTYLS